MSDNALKTPFMQSLDTYVTNAVNQGLQSRGLSLPASVVSVDDTKTIVTVKFEIETQAPTAGGGVTSILQFPNVTCPVFGPQYLRYPIQVGDQGVCLAANAYLGQMAGFTTETATLTNPGNLSALVFFPIGNKTFEASENPDAAILYGPDGAIIRDTENTVHIKVDGQGNVIIWGAKSLSTDVNGYGQRITHTGGTSWRIDNYKTGATVTTVDHAINPPEIPPP